MPLIAHAFSSITGVPATSDIESVDYRNSGLTVVIARSLDQDRKVHGLSVQFERVSGFRLLDELELVRYWTSDGFVRSGHVLEIEDGGWSSEENMLQTYVTERREWLVVSGNACISVFSASAPHIAEVILNQPDVRA